MKDVLIIGAGPAGLTAGIYCCRAGLNTAIIEKLYAGGQAFNTDLIENYPGFPDGISGQELASLMERQAKRLGCEIISDQALSINPGKYFTVKLLSTSIEARSIILCNGASPKSLQLENEEDYIGHGLSYCAVCDGFFFRGKDVAVVGGGDTALGDALYLAKFARKVYLIHRRAQLRGAKLLQDRIAHNERIQFIPDSVVVQLNGQPNLSSITILNKTTDLQSELQIQGIFIAVGNKPDTDMLHGTVELDENGYIIADQNMRTSVPGIFAAGDSRQKHLRQIITAASDGAIAAENAIEYINNLEL